MSRRAGHGWWPFLTPILSFLAVLELGRRFPPRFAPFFEVASLLVPSAALIYFARRTGYPELRGLRWSAKEFSLDVLVGAAGAALWIAPYLAFDWWRPGPEGAFDPEYLGASHEWLAIWLRALGFAVVTPFAEELFVRGWLARYADVFDQPRDFRDVPIGHYSLRSFVIVAIYFTVSHAFWHEYPVAFVWIVLTQLWFYRRRHLLAMVLVHAVSNLAIFLFVLVADGRFQDADGSPLSLWFFL